MFGYATVGASNVGVNATYESLLNSECTSCEVQADHSAYWTPLLYYAYGITYQLTYLSSSPPFLTSLSKWKLR